MCRRKQQFYDSVGPCKCQFYNEVERGRSIMRKIIFIIKTKMLTDVLKVTVKADRGGKLSSYIRVVYKKQEKSFLSYSVIENIAPLLRPVLQ